MAETDEALVAKSRRRDRAAFAELVRRTARLIYSRQFLAVRDRQLAEDLTQETFLVAWRSIDQVTDAAGFRPWLFTVARTVALDAHRARSRRKRSAPLMSDDAAPMAAAASLTPEQSADRREQCQRALDALAMLPAEYREPLSLRYLAGADYQTIGRQLGLSNGSLRGLLGRGMTRLRQMLRADADSSSGSPDQRIGAKDSPG